jgi:CheY-like chemotaxis protein
LEKSGGILDIRTLKKKNRIIIEFEDNGVGIQKEHLRKIFDPFFTTKEVGKGTGLGLSVVYGIVTEHDGVMNVESVVEKGTKFTIELPILKETIKEEEKHMEKPVKPVEKVSILVVEDEDSLREFLVEALMAEGYGVDMTSNGEEAIKLLDNREYDIIISDMKMPGISGQNVYTYVQRKNPTMAERMIFITGDILGQETQNFLKISGARFIEKPFQLDELFSLLAELLSGRKKSN